MIGTDVAYRECADITRLSATTFFSGIRLLPADRRSALCAIYAFARRVDDIADGSLTSARRLAMLAEQRRRVDRLQAQSDDPVCVALGDAVRRFPIPVGALHDLLDGAEMDVRGASYERWPDLEAYCRLVAGSVGRLSLGVFGCAQAGPAAERTADDLGVALQLTNILRDVREDMHRGRMYLPRRDLASFGCVAGAGGLAGDVEGLIHFEVRRTRGWFERGLRLLPLLDRRSAMCVGVMAGAYWRILERIDGRPAEALSRKVTLSGWEKGLVAARTVATVGL